MCVKSRLVCNPHFFSSLRHVKVTYLEWFRYLMEMVWERALGRRKEKKKKNVPMNPEPQKESVLCCWKLYLTRRRFTEAPYKCSSSNKCVWCVSGLQCVTTQRLHALCHWGLQMKHNVLPVSHFLSAVSRGRSRCDLSRCFWILLPSASFAAALQTDKISCEAASSHLGWDFIWRLHSLQKRMQIISSGGLIGSQFSPRTQST